MICVFYTAHVATETVLVELFMSCGVPEAAGIGRNFVCKNDFAVGCASELDLEVNEVDIAL